MLGRYLLVSDDLTMTLSWNHLATVERAEGLPGDPWDGEWFEEDYCEGPGQALIVNPKGEVKPCCGFASDLDQLTIGNIHSDSVEEIIARGRKHPFVGKIFREGLTAIRDEILARDPDGAAGCDEQPLLLLLVRADAWAWRAASTAAAARSAAGPATKANYTGELIQLGVRT